LAEKYRPEEFRFVFVYVREAHPGEHLPHHASIDQKLQHARRFRDRWSACRPILVDDLDGPLHRAYGTLPNMTYIVSATGRVAYRADWTDAHSLEWVLEYLKHESMEKATTRRVAPFYAELAGHRSAIDYPRVFIDGLARGGGVRAVEEFISAVEQRGGSAEADPMRRAWSQIREQVSAPLSDS
jgi:hypothetical protein